MKNKKFMVDVKVGDRFYHDSIFKTKPEALNRGKELKRHSYKTVRIKNLNSGKSSKV